MRRLVIIVAVVVVGLLVAGGITAVALAQRPQAAAPTPEPGGAAAHHGSEAPAPRGGERQGGSRQAEGRTSMQEALQPLVDNGTLTQEQLDAVLETLSSVRSEGRERSGSGSGSSEGDSARGVVDTATAAEVIGISAEELSQAVKGGQTIADVALAHNVDPQAVIDALLAELRTRLDAQVAAGEQTREAADQILEQAATGFANRVQGQLSQPGEDSPGA